MQFFENIENANTSPTAANLARNGVPFANSMANNALQTVAPPAHTFHTVRATPEIDEHNMLSVPPALSYTNIGAGGSSSPSQGSAVSSNRLVLSAPDGISPMLTNRGGRDDAQNWGSLSGQNDRDDTIAQLFLSLDDSVQPDSMDIELPGVRRKRCISEINGDVEGPEKTAKARRG